jgi:hypothetical protein
MAVMTQPDLVFAAIEERQAAGSAAARYAHDRPSVVGPIGVRRVKVCSKCREPHTLSGRLCTRCKQRKANGTPEMRACRNETCDTSFPTNWNQAYCSDDCQSIQARRRSRRRYADQKKAAL